MTKPAAGKVASADKNETTKSSSIADFYVEVADLLDKRKQLEHELTKINQRLAELSGRGAGKRSLQSQIKQAAEMMELDRRCSARDGLTTEKQVIIEFLEDSLRGKNQRLSKAKKLYPTYRRALTRWREKPKD